MALGVVYSARRLQAKPPAGGIGAVPEMVVSVERFLLCGKPVTQRPEVGTCTFTSPTGGGQWDVAW